jgi:hypothetical protein
MVVEDPFNGWPGAEIAAVGYFEKRSPRLNLFRHPADGFSMTPDDLVQLELMLNRFRRLIAEIMRGSLRRNSFEPWEIGILLDFQTCAVNPQRRLEMLKAYQKAVEHQMETGPGPPMKFSEYLQLKSTRRPKIP